MKDSRERCTLGSLALETSESAEWKGGLVDLDDLIIQKHLKEESESLFLFEDSATHFSSSGQDVLETNIGLCEGLKAMGRKARKGVGPFSRVREALKGGYFGKQVLLEGLSPGEKKVLSAFLDRKAFKKSLPKSERSVDEGLRQLGTSETRPTKRNEEKIRFVLKLLFRELREELVAEGVKDPQSEFFARYFLCFPESEKEFKIFRSARGLQASLPLPVLLEAFRSPALLAAFRRLRGTFLDSPLLAKYMAQTPIRIDKIFARFRRGDPAEKENSAIEYFRNNSQCKLPWTAAEVIEAVKFVSEIAEKKFGSFVAPSDSFKCPSKPHFRNC